MAGEFFVPGEYPIVMENSASPAEKDIDRDSLLLASVILLEVSRTISGIHALVTLILRYVMTGISITDNVIGLFLHESAQLE